MYISNNYIQKDHLSCFPKAKQKDLETFQYLSEISADLDEEITYAHEQIPVLSEIFHDYYKLFKSDKIALQKNYNTSYGLYFVSYPRAKNMLLHNYAFILKRLFYQKFFMTIINYLNPIRLLHKICITLLMDYTL